MYIWFFPETIKHEMVWKDLDVDVNNYLVVSEPYSVVCNGKREDMVYKRLTLRVVAWS